ncbi:hypothetical protein FQN57_004840 [Myotisia sp. PD_48]|nr:hypothetical protein FQN57_004840 [Myotisia sp. PD_48]
MATPTSINITMNNPGVFNFNPKPETAEKATELLRADMEKHTMYFNDAGFHNHIVHHVLTSFALGASPSNISRAYTEGSSYQRPAERFDEEVVKTLSDKDEFCRRAGKRNQYANFLQFFIREIESKGAGLAVKEYIFAETEIAEDMLLRLFGGLIHPMIHLGFGLEFNQPAIIAQALAETATHEASLKTFAIPAEQAAGKVGNPGKKTLVQLQKELHDDPIISGSMKWSDTNKILGGVMYRAPEKMIDYAAQFTVGPDQIEEKLAEIINAAGTGTELYIQWHMWVNSLTNKAVLVYFTGASQNPPKEIKFDFFYLHAVNSCIFLPTLLSQPWMSERNKIRLLEWKGRIDLLIYASRKCPKLLPEEITNYPIKYSWEEVFARVITNPRDDGHAVKLVRLLALGERLCKPYEDNEGFPIVGDMWLKLGNMVVESTSGPGALWVRSTGFPEAWVDVPERAKL